jgi:hypothetical protein
MPSSLPFSARTLPMSDGSTVEFTKYALSSGASLSLRTCARGWRCCHVLVCRNSTTWIWGDRPASPRVGKRCTDLRLLHCSLDHLLLNIDNDGPFANHVADALVPSLHTRVHTSESAVRIDPLRCVWAGGGMVRSAVTLSTASHGSK